MEEFGYEESWEKDGVQVDINASLREGEDMVFGLWLSAEVAGGRREVYPCHMEVGEVVRYGWMEGLEVRGPWPMEEALRSAYGENWRHPMGRWVWDRDPFLTGSWIPTAAGRSADFLK